MTLHSAAGAVAYLGSGVFRAMIDIGRREFPGVPVRWVLDCGDARGLALGAVRIGVPAIRLLGPPEVLARSSRTSPASSARSSMMIEVRPRSEGSTGGAGGLSRLALLFPCSPALSPSDADAWLLSPCDQAFDRIGRSLGTGAVADLGRPRAHRMNVEGLPASVRKAAPTFSGVSWSSMPTWSVAPRPASASAMSR